MRGTHRNSTPNFTTMAAQQLTSLRNCNWRVTSSSPRHRRLPKCSSAAFSSTLNNSSSSLSKRTFITSRKSRVTCHATQGQQDDQQQQSPQAADAAATQPSQQQHQQQQAASWQLQAAFQDPPTWPAFLGTLFQQGALLGPLLDGIHSRVGLQVYDLAPITLGPLHTSLLVPPLLGTFYVVLGLLTVAADNIVNSSSSSSTTAAAQQQQRSGAGSDDISVGLLALNFGALAAALALSAHLYESQTTPSTVFAVLAAVTALNWALFDRTKQGVALAMLCGLGAPAAEVVLMGATHCWHYPRADVAGVFVSWVPWCYAFYTPAVSNLARYLWATCRPPPAARV